MKKLDKKFPIITRDTGLFINYKLPNSGYKSTPAIMLKGQWIREAGFDCGTSITVTCEEGCLVIVPREEASYVDAFEESGRETMDKVAEKKGRY